MIADVPADGHAWRVNYWNGGGFYGPLSEWIEEIQVYRVTDTNALERREEYYNARPKRHPVDLVFETEAEAREFVLEKLREHLVAAEAEVGRRLGQLRQAEEAWL